MTPPAKPAAPVRRGVLRGRESEDELQINPSATRRSACHRDPCWRLATLARERSRASARDHRPHREVQPVLVLRPGATRVDDGSDELDALVALVALVYRGADGGIALHPLCELNARLTFGLVARAEHDAAA
jgi:hypothetical protein